ncbi:MAG TPA: metal-dependent hydrolase [Thermodesulfobacteriota bacterium]|nr:metal-dependent hydrolase [Thermodesulfobacteriota bacterium]
MGQTKIKYISHAGFQITSPSGKVLYIDPWYENPIGGFSLDDVKTAALVLVTHDHFDHVGQAPDIVKKTGGLLVANVETGRRLQSEAFIPAEKVCYFGYGMNIGGSLEYEGITVTMTQAFHSTATGAPCGYVIRLEDGTVLYHAGDTGIFDSMKLIGELYKPDIAMLPIGSVFTMDPQQAAWATKLISPKKVIPMHYKTFPILVQDPAPFVELVGKQAPGVQVVPLAPGGEYTYTK